MSLDASTKSLYAPGGASYNGIRNAYGQAAADEAYRLSLTVADRSQITEAMNKYRAQYSNPNEGTESFWGNLWTQLTTDPLAAPLESANNQLGKAVWNVVKNPWVLLVVALLVWWKLGFPGAPALRKKFA